MQGTLHPVFSSRHLLLASTAKPVTPFEGLASLIEFVKALKLGEVFAAHALCLQQPQRHRAAADPVSLNHLHHHGSQADSPHRLDVRGGADDFKIGAANLVFLECCPAFIVCWMPRAYAM